MDTSESKSQMSALDAPPKAGYNNIIGDYAEL
jgi:hypothetical protein